MKRTVRVFVAAFATAAIVCAPVSGSPARADDQSTDAGAPVPPPSYAIAAASPDWLPTPAGLAHKSCVHQVPNGSNVSEDGTVSLNGVVVDKIPPCPYTGMVAVPKAASTDQSAPSSAAAPPVPLANGWWLDSWWTSPSQVVSHTAKWTVPANPTSNGAVVFLFPSIEPSNTGSAIVQPVLQWGVSAAGGGNYWRMANWFVPSSGSAVHSPLYATAAGRAITGTMTRSSGTDARWRIGYTQSSGLSGSLSVATGITSWKAVQGGVLEVYNASACNKLPNTTSVKFSSIAIKSPSGSITPSWTNHRRVTSCSTSISSTSTTTTVGWKTS